jgi:hypothetical protein
MPNNPYQTEGDLGFVGISSRENPVNVQPGFVQYAQNMRMDRGEAKVRAGCLDLTTPELVSGGKKFLTSCLYTNATGEQFIVLVSETGLYTYNTTTKVFSSVRNYPSQVIGGTTYVRSISESDPVDAFQAENKVYILRGYSRNEVKTNTTGGGTHAVDYNHTTDTVTLTFAAAHGYSVGDEIIVSIPTHPDLSGTFLVTASTVGGSASKLTYFVDVGGADKTHNTFSCIKAKAPLVFDGSSTVSVVPQAVDNAGADDQYPYIYSPPQTDACMPPADFGMYFQGRIVLCVSRDEIAASNYYEPNVFDVSLDQFKINLGDNDYIVGFVPFQEDKFLIFKRNSIYYAYIPPPAITNTTIDRGIDNSSFVQTLTNQFGCIARRSITFAGQQVFFLSDRGVYLLNNTLDLKLVGDQKPLSDLISDIIEDINTQYAQNACGLFFNNRYYLSIPLVDSVVAPTTNNATLVYSLLNQAWESVDKYPQDSVVGSYAPRVLLQAVYNNRNQMFAVSLRKLHLSEQGDIDILNNGSGTPVLGVMRLGDTSGADSAVFVTGVIQTPIPAILTSRRYSFKTFDQKRFSGLQTDMLLDDNTNIDISAIAINPDTAISLINFTSTTVADKNVRAKVSRRAYALDIKFTINSGRPTIRGLTIDAVTPGRNLVSTE